MLVPSILVDLKIVYWVELSLVEYWVELSWVLSYKLIFKTTSMHVCNIDTKTSLQKTLEQKWYTVYSFKRSALNNSRWQIHTNLQCSWAIHGTRFDFFSQSWLTCRCHCHTVCKWNVCRLPTLFFRFSILSIGLSRLDETLVSRYCSFKLGASVR